MPLSYEEMTEIGEEAREHFQEWTTAVTREDRVALKERCSVDLEKHELIRAHLIEWGEPFTVGGCSFVYVGDGQIIGILQRG